MTGLIYDLDTTGSNPDNTVRDELHLVTASTEPGEFNIIVPKYMPYFRESMKVIHVPTGRELTPGLDWQPGHLFDSATYETESIRGGIYGSLIIMDRSLTGEFRLAEYNTLGGTWLLDQPKLLEILAIRNKDPRSATYEQVSGKPTVFPPTGHNHPAVDYTGFAEVIVSTERIANAVEQQTQAWLDNPPILMENYYLKEEVSDLLSSTVYNEVDQQLAVQLQPIQTRMDSLEQLVIPGLQDRFTKAESDARYALKVESMTRQQIETLADTLRAERYDKTQSDTRYYTKAQTYNQQEIDQMLADVGAAGYTKGEIDNFFTQYWKKSETYNRAYLDFEFARQNDIILSHRDRLDVIEQTTIPNLSSRIDNNHQLMLQRTYSTNEIDNQFVTYNAYHDQQLDTRETAIKNWVTAQNYVTGTSLSSTLASYATQSWVNNRLTNYATNTSVNGQYDQLNNRMDNDFYTDHEVNALLTSQQQASEAYTDAAIAGVNVGPASNTNMGGIKIASQDGVLYISTSESGNAIP